MMTDRFWSHDGDSADTHSTLDAARSAAEHGMDLLRDDSSEGWDEDAANRVAWGVRLGAGTRTKYRSVEDLDAAGKTDEADRMRANGWDFCADYEVLSVGGALADVVSEREKQRARWGNQHDDDHDDGALADAGAIMAAEASSVGPYLVSNGSNVQWALNLRHKHRSDRRKQLVIAAALLLAEVERLDREAARG